MPDAAAAPAHRDACDSCGAPDDDLVAVQRVYVTPAAWDLTDPDEAGAETVAVMDGTERWCFPCRSHYPHRPVG